MITIIIYLFIGDENKTILRGCYKKKDMENGCLYRYTSIGGADCYTQYPIIRNDDQR